MPIYFNIQSGPKFFQFSPLSLSNFLALSRARVTSEIFFCLIYIKEKDKGIPTEYQFSSVA